MTDTSAANTDNSVTDTEATVIIQAGTTGPIHLGNGDQYNGMVISGNARGITVINGDNHASANRPES